MSIKKAVIILLVIAVIGVIAISVIFSGKKKTVYTTTPAEIGRIVQTVSETGTVKSAGEINLSFLNAGRIDKIYFKVGDKVKNGDLLAQLDYSGLELSKKEAQANLEVAQQTLNKLLAGATIEDKAVANAGVQQAKTAYDSAYSELLKTRKAVDESIAQAQKRSSDLESKSPSDMTTAEQAVITAETNFNNARSTYQKAIDNTRDNALTTLDDKISKANSALDTINSTLNDSDGKELIGISNRNYLNNAKSAYTEAKTLLDKAILDRQTAKADPAGNSNLINALNSTLVALNKTYISLDYCYKALENSVTSTTFTQAELDALKAGISAQLTSITAGVSATQAARQSFDSAVLAYDTNIAAMNQALNQAKVAYDNAVLEAKNALATAQLTGDQQVTAAETRAGNALKSLQVAQSQQNKTIAKPTSYDISLAQARVRQAQAAIDSVSKQIENSQIKTPIDGTLTKSNYLPGEQVTPSVAAISMITTNNLEIEVLISEADIAKLKLSDKAEITLDSFGDDVKFYGAVTFIEPAETVVQGVIYYKVKVNFDPKESQVKSGMTANVTIVAAEKENALIVPSRAVIQKNGDGKIIRVLLNNQVQEKPVEIGLSGDDGLVEILSGIQKGDQTITAIKEN